MEQLAYTTNEMWRVSCYIQRMYVTPKFGNRAVISYNCIGRIVVGCMSNWAEAKLGRWQYGTAGGRGTHCDIGTQVEDSGTHCDTCTCGTRPRPASDGWGSPVTHQELEMARAQEQEEKKKWEALYNDYVRDTCPEPCNHWYCVGDLRDVKGDCGKCSVY